MLKIKRFLIVLTIILLVNPISFAQIIMAEGTLADKTLIEIENSDELEEIEDNLAENYVLTDDIDLKEAEWEAIDRGEFTGTLLGDDFIIDNMPAEYEEDENLGLFTEVEDLDNIDVEIEFVEEEIENTKELEDIKEDLTGNYILTKDIDLKDAEWEPIDASEFTGTLTGDDFIIQNMPAEYEKDDNFGLFTEVEDIKNIDVEVEFAEEVENKDAEEPQAEEENVEEDSEEPQVEKKNGEEEPEEPQAEAEVVEEETEEPQAEEEQEKSETSKQTMAVGLSEDVGDYEAFKKALENSDITTINLTADISKDGNKKKITIKEPLKVINGYNSEGDNFILENDSDEAMIKMDRDRDGGNITFKNVRLSPLTNQAILEGPDRITEFNVTFENVKNGSDAAKTDGWLVDAKMPQSNVNVIFRGTTDFSTSSSSVNGNKERRRIIKNAKSVIIEKNAKVTWNTNGKAYETKAVGAKLHVKEGGQLVINGSGDNARNSAIELEGKDSKVLVEGGTLNIDSKRNLKGEGKGLIMLRGENSAFSVTKGGQVDISQNEGSILYMHSNNTKGKINIDEGSSVKFLVNKGNGETDAVVYLHKANNGFEINLNNNSKFEIIKESGKAMGLIATKGKEHKILVSGGSKFLIHKEGDSDKPSDTDKNNSTHAHNQALHLTGNDPDQDKLPKITLNDEGSKVKLISDNGVAMHMTEGIVINVNQGTTFIAHGRTKSKNRGIIDTDGTNGKTDKAESLIKMTNPAFYDFRNNKTEGYVFHVGREAKFEATDTDVAVWERGENAVLDGPYDHQWDKVTYDLSKINFKTIGENSPEDLKDVMAEKGLEAYARISSGGNATPPEGELKFDSWPDELNFKVQIKSQSAKYPVDTNLDFPLVISDTRNERVGWKLKARMSDEFENQLPNELTLIYREDNKDKKLNEFDEELKSYIYEKNPPVDEKTFNLSNEWNQDPDKDGMFIEVDPGIMRSDNYQGEVIWTLEDTP